MKTIRQHLDSGISTLRDIKSALQLTMQLEFATIPPYLCAQWSISADPDRVEAVLHRIVNQEMHHFALAGNLMTAIGGVPKVANLQFIPKYPMRMLPGGIPQRIPIDLSPLNIRQLEVFMQIEHPGFSPIAILAKKPPATIGEFYDAIIDGLKAVKPVIDPQAFGIPVPNFQPIKNIHDAIDTLERIKVEGEGLQDSPDQPASDGDRTTFAHYYSFKELYVQRRLIYDGDRWSFTGGPITLPEIHEFGGVEVAG